MFAESNSDSLSPKLQSIVFFLPKGYQFSKQTQPYRFRILVIYYTPQHVSAVQIGHHQVGAGQAKRE